MFVSLLQKQNKTKQDTLWFWCHNVHIKGWWYNLKIVSQYLKGSCDNISDDIMDNMKWHSPSAYTHKNIL